MTRICICPGNFEASVELNKKRNKRTESSCNTCGGRFLVDGIGAISANMLSTVRLEVSNSINPELNWKKVTKGRRSRKPTSRSLNWGGKLKNQSPKRVGDFSGFDSDKFCEIASDQRAPPDKAEHIPIKKRRHLLRSKSPSKVPFGRQEESLSPQSLATPTRSEELELLSDHNHSSGHMSSDSYSSSQLAALKFCNGIRHNIMDLKFTGVANGSYYNSEDFSGIALLAAAACSNGMDDDSGTEKEGRYQVEKDNATHESRGECPDSLETLSVIPRGLDEDEQLMGDKRSVSPKIDRLHWDLNTLMDSWEQPCDDQVMGNAKNDGDGSKKEKPEIDIGKEQMVPEVCQHDSENFMHSADKDTKISPSVLKTDGYMSGAVSCLNRTSVKEEIYDLNLRKDFESLEIKSIDKGISAHVDEKDTKISPSVLKTDGNLSGAVSCLNRTSVKEEKLCDLNLRKDIESLEITSIDKGISAHVDDKDMSLGDHLANKSIHASTALVSEGASTVASVGVVAIQDSEYTQESIMGDPACETGSKCAYNEDHIRTCQLPDDMVLAGNMTDTVISKILDVETSHSTSDEADNCHPSTKCEDLSVSKATVGDGQPIEGEVKWQEKVASSSIAIGADSQVQFEPKELSSRCSDDCGSNEEELTFLQGSSKIFKEGPQGDDLASHSMKIGSFLEDCHKSDISHEERGQTIVCEDMNGFQAGYDSPFEDGELRGSALCSWEENEVECVDYDSDGNGVYSDAADHHGSEVVEAGSEGSQGSEKRVSSASGGVEADFSKSMSLKNLRVQSRRCEDKIDIAGKKGSDAAFGTMVHSSADTSVEGNDDLKRRHGFGLRWYNEEFGLRTDRGKLQSRIEGPLYLDATDRKDSILLQHRRPLSLGCSYTRPERDFSPEKFVGRYRSAFHVRDRNAGDGHWGNWDSRSRYPSMHHGPEGHGNPRRRSFADLADRFGGMDPRDQRQSINYSSKDIQRPPGLRRRLSVDRDDCYDGPRRMLPGRGGIMNRNSRGGSGSYSQKNTRGFRQEGYLPLPEDGDAPSVRMRHYLSRRDRSFSPSSGKSGRISLPRRKSRSRSRSSSPRAWHSQRDWNMSMRRQGRSPELRTETRMERIRVPFKKSSYVAEYGEGFVSPTRRHFSPDRKTRWMDDQNFVGNQLRRGRSPVRGIRRNQRFDAIGSDRLKSDDYFRPMIRTRRSPMMGNTGRVSKFENNYNDSRHDDRGEMMHRVRHSSDATSIGRRIGHDVDDKFEAGGNSQNNEDIQSTDVQGGGGGGGRGEDKRTFIIQQQ